MIPFFNIPFTLRNAFALPVRLGILGPLLLVTIVGEYATVLGDWLNDRLPSCER